MKRRLSLLLLIGALLGLLGQEMAFAGVVPVEKIEQAAAAMSPECAEMMGLSKQTSESEKPCQGMTPECIAKMGCAVPVALVPPLLVARPSEYRGSNPKQAVVSPLSGRETPPEHHPPTRLG